MLSQIFQLFAAGCASNTFFGIPTWYHYLVDAGRMVTKVDAATGVTTCDLAGDFQWQNGGDIVLILLGILDILLRVAGMVAVGFIIYGGIQYITSEGQPDKTKDAMQTIINALVGLVIAIVATAFVSFIGNTLTK